MFGNTTPMIATYTLMTNVSQQNRSANRQQMFDDTASKKQSSLI